MAASLPGEGGASERPGMRIFGRGPYTLREIARLAAAGAVIVLWLVLSALSVGATWLQSAPGSPSPVPTQAANVTPTPGAPGPESARGGSTYHPVLRTAREVCPPERPLLMLNSGTAIHQLAHYYMYPRRVTNIDPDDPLGEGDLSAQKGACVATYGAPGAARLEPLLDRVSEIICVAEGCLYRVK